MQTTANPAIRWLNPSRFWELFWREMAPTPGRREAALRITLSCLICTVPVMAFHLQQPLIVMILMFAISKEDTTHHFAGDNHWHSRLHNRLRRLARIFLVRARFGMAACVGGARIHHLGTFSESRRHPRATGNSHQPSVGDGNDHSGYGFLARIPQPLSVLLLVGRECWA